MSARKVYSFRGKTMSRSQIVQEFGLPKYLVLKATKQRYYKQALEDLLWKKKHGYKISQHVYRKEGFRECADSVIEAIGCSYTLATGRLRRWQRGEQSHSSVLRKPGTGKIYAKDGKEATVKEVQDKTGLNYKSSNARIHRWLSGKITYEDLMKPVQVIFSTDPDGEPGGRASTYTDKLVVGSQGPRRRPEDLKVGTWEKENIPDPGYFHKGGGRSSVLPGHPGLIQTGGF